MNPSDIMEEMLTRYQTQKPRVKVDQVTEGPQSMEGPNTSTTNLRSMEALVRTINGLRWTIVPKGAHLATRRKRINKNEWRNEREQTQGLYGVLILFLRETSVFGAILQIDFGARDQGELTGSPLVSNWWGRSLLRSMSSMAFKFRHSGLSHETSHLYDLF